MGILGGLLFGGGTIVCCGAIFVIGLVALVFWYWRNQPPMISSPVAPQPPIQATIEHPTAAAPAAPAPAEVPVAPAPAAAAPDAPSVPEAPTVPAETPAPDAAPQPPSADV